MRVIHIPGLNCYHDCVVTLAYAFGIDYADSLSSVWSEWDMNYDPICRVYLTQRMPAELERKGMLLKRPCTTPEEREMGWDALDRSEFAIIGMDAYKIPWNPLYGLQHGPHYFLIQKGSLYCVDPTYGLCGIELTETSLSSDPYALIPVQRVEAAGLEPIHAISLMQQAREVQRQHPQRRELFYQQAEVWLQGTEEERVRPAKLVDALQTGRCLYRHYLEQKGVDQEQTPLFFSDSYYRAWKAVKNGFYKAALQRKSLGIFQEAYERLCVLLEEEIALAEQILLGEGEPNGS